MPENVTRRQALMGLAAAAIVRPPVATFQGIPIHTATSVPAMGVAVFNSEAFLSLYGKEVLSAWAEANDYGAYVWGPK